MLNRDKDRIKKELEEKKESYELALRRVKSSVPIQDYNKLKNELEKEKNRISKLQNENDKLKGSFIKLEQENSRLKMEQKSIISQYQSIQNHKNSQPAQSEKSRIKSPPPQRSECNNGPIQKKETLDRSQFVLLGAKNSTRTT